MDKLEIKINKLKRNKKGKHKRRNKKIKMENQKINEN